MARPAGASPGRHDAPLAGPEAEGERGGSLVVQTSFLGDVVLTTPLIAELARGGPVDVVVTPASAPLLANNPDIRRLLVYDKRGADRGIGGILRMAARIRQGLARNGSGATAYIAQRSLRSAALALLAGPRRRIGFRDSPGTALYTHRVDYRGDLHHAERLWRLAADGGGGATMPRNSGQLRPRLFPGDEERAAVDSLLAPLGGAPFIALAPGSVWATKRWPYYAALAQRLSTTHPVVVVGGAADSPLAAEIVGAAGAGRAIDATGRLSLLASAALIGRAELLVTNDSSPLHLASAMGTRTVALFGPTVPAFGFGPLAPGSVVADHPALPCRPCHKHGPSRCPLGHWRCMREIEPDRIHELTLETLS